MMQIATYRHKVFDLSKDKEIIIPVLDGVEITLKNKKSERSFKGTTQNGILIFENLSDGEFVIEAKEKTSDTAKYDLTVNCGNKDEAGKIFEDVLMWEKGVPNPLKNIPAGTPIAASNDNSQSSNSNSTGDGKILNGKTANLVRPEYPAAARAVRASGAVNVILTINETGRVISAYLVSGHPLLQSAAVKAARATRFSPTLLVGVPVRVSGIVVYNFAP